MADEAKTTDAGRRWAVEDVVKRAAIAATWDGVLPPAHTWTVTSVVDDDKTRRSYRVTVSVKEELANG